VLITFRFHSSYHLIGAGKQAPRHVVAILPSAKRETVVTDPRG